jgi:imidazolonepropionase-like amidohydrolase
MLANRARFKHHRRIHVSRPQTQLEHCLMHRIFQALIFPALLLLSGSLAAQSLVDAPDRRADEGAGPFATLLIRNAIVIDGSGAPPAGPVNIVVSQNRIQLIDASVPEHIDHEIDATGMYVLPGFVDMHAHCGTPDKAPEAEYVFKLWLAHGVTTVRGVPLTRNDWVIMSQQRSEKNEIVAPRIINYQRPPADLKTPDEARAWVRQAPLDGIQGLKLGAYPPEIMAALLTEAKRLNLGSVAHLHQMGIAQMNALDAARLGLQTVTHFYGHFEALMKDHVIQPWPLDMNYNDEQMRFAQVARLWDRIYEPGSPEWIAYLKAHRELGTVFDPTFTIYSANRDVMRARTAEWHHDYTIPSLWNYFQPSRNVHGSYWFDWTTADEIAWRNFYQVWFRLVNDYKKMGGRVTTGADSGYIYDTFGFGYIEELELLQEAGFHPLEVIQAATWNGSLTIHEAMGKPMEFGVLRPGMLADMIVVPENPLQNLKVLFGTGAVRLNDQSGTLERVGGIRWTIKDGIVYDAHQLLADVREMVRGEREGLSGGGDSTSLSPQK